MDWIIYILVFLAIGILLLIHDLVRKKALIEQQSQQIDDICDALAEGLFHARSWFTDSENEDVDKLVKDWDAYGYGDYRRLVIAGMLYREETLRKSAVKGHFLEDDIVAPPSIQIDDWFGHGPGDEVDIIILNNTKK